jgi:hypothetical protein
MTFLQKIGCIDWNNKPSTSQNSTLLRQITFAKSRPTPPLKMEKKLVNEQEEPLNPKTQKELALKSLPNTNNASFLRMCKVQL